MQQDSPHLELYMWSLYQEFPDSQGNQAQGATFQVEAFKDESGNIVEYRKIFKKKLDITPAPTPTPTPTPPPWSGKLVWAMDLGDKLQSTTTSSLPLGKTVIREEDFGAIILDPITDRVFKVNLPGLALTRELILYFNSHNSIIGFKSESCSSESDFIRFLELLSVSGLLGNSNANN